MQSQSGNFLLDAGIKFTDIQKGVNYDISGIDFVAYSHGHFDHLSPTALKELIKRGTTLFMPQECIEKYSLQNTRNVHVAQAGTQIDHKAFAIMPFELEHINTDGTNCENLGFIVADLKNSTKLAYITDTMFVKNKMPSGLNYMIIECNFSEDINDHTDIARSINVRRLNSHMSLSTLLKLLNTMDLSAMERIYICHVSDSSIADDDKIKLEIQKKTGCLVTLF